MENIPENDNTQRVYCEDDSTWRIYSDICDKHAIDIYYQNHLKSLTHKNNFHERQRLSNSNTV